MNINQIWSAIEQSSKDDWIENHAGDGITETVYKNDVNIRIGIKIICHMLINKHAKFRNVINIKLARMS